MAYHHRLRASALGAFLVFSAMPGGAATGELPDLGSNVSVGRLAAGGTVIVGPKQGAPVAAVELWYRVPSTGFGAKPAPGIARLAAQAVAGSRGIVGDALGKVVSDVGGRLAITTYSDSVAISAVVPATSARTVVKAMTTAFFAPIATEEGFKTAQRDVGAEALISTFDAETVIRDAVFAQLFTSAPQHYPALGDAKELSAITYADVRSFATRAFRSQNATLVVSGAVDPAIATSANPGRPGAPGDGAELPATAVLAATSAPVTKTFVQPSGGYGWAGPKIADQRDATAMDFIADYLFRIDEGAVTKKVAEQVPDALLVGQFITLHDPGVMFVAYAGKNTDALKALVDEGFAAIRKPLAATDFAGALESFKYHLLSDLQTPSQQADNFGWYSVEGSAAYAPGVGGENGAYFKAANSLTPAFVASVAEKYLGKPPVIVTLKPDEKTLSTKVKARAQ